MSSRNSKSSTLSMENMEEVERIFKRFDKNGDGRISSSELAGVVRALGSDPTQEEVKRMMVEIDTDGDGFIDLKEFADFHRGGSNGDGSIGDGSKELREAFDMYDKDKNGLISAAELHRVFKSLGEKSSIRDCRKMIGSVDADGDGSVNFEEFKKMMGCGNKSNSSSRY